MGTTMCVPGRRGEEGLATYFGIPASTLVVCEEKVVRQLTHYVPTVPILLQDIAFYWDTQGGALGDGRTDMEVLSDCNWTAMAEGVINDFVRRSQLLSLSKQNVGYFKGKTKKFVKELNEGGRVFQKSFQEIVGKVPLRAQHFLSILILFLCRLPEPLVSLLFVRQSESILANTKMTADEKAVVLEKVRYHAFELPSPVEHAVFQFLKVLLKRHCAELTTAVVEAVVRHIVREPAEHFVRLTTQQLLGTSKGETTAPSVGQMVVPQPSSDEANAMADASCSHDSVDGGPERAGVCLSENAEAKQLAPESTKSSFGSGVGTDNNGVFEKEKEAFEDVKQPAEGMAMSLSAMCHVDSTELSYSTESGGGEREKQVTDRDHRQLPVVAEANTDEIMERVQELENSICHNLLGMKATARRYSDTFSYDKEELEELEEEWEELEGEPLPEVRNLEGERRSDAKAVTSLRTPNVSTASILTDGRRNQRVLSNLIKEDVSAGVPVTATTTTTSDMEGRNKLISDASGFLKFSSVAAQQKDIFEPHCGPSFLGSPKKHSVLLSNQQGTTTQVLPTNSTGEYIAGPITPTNLSTFQEVAHLRSSCENDFCCQDATLYVERYPCHAALMAAKKVFLGKENLPPKQILPEDRVSFFLEKSTAAVSLLVSDPELGTARKITQETGGTDGDVCGGDMLLRGKSLDADSRENAADATCVDEEDCVQEKTIQPYLVRIQQLADRFEALERVVAGTGIKEATESFLHVMQAIRRTEEDLTQLKNVVQEMTTSYSGTTESIAALHSQVRQQCERLEGFLADNECRYSSLLNAKEAAIEAQRRCATLEKLQIEDRRIFHNMALKLKDLTFKLEQQEKKNLDLKIEISLLQRQNALLQEKLMSEL